MLCGSARPPSTLTALEYPGTSYIAAAYNQRNDNIASVKVDFTPSDAVQLFAKAYGHWWFSHYTEFDNEIGNPGVLDVSDDHDFWGYRDYGLNLVAKIAPKGGLEYVAGYELRATAATMRSSSSTITASRSMRSSARSAQPPSSCPGCNSPPVRDSTIRASVSPPRYGMPADASRSLLAPGRRHIRCQRRQLCGAQPRDARTVYRSYTYAFH